MIFMNTSQTSSQVPNSARFQDALLALRPIADGQMKMLREHFRAPGHRLTATQLADAAGYPNYRTANLHYGKLGRALGEYLSFPPPQQDKGEPLYTSVIAFGEDGTGIGDKAHYVWTMRPELVEALSDLPWGFRQKI